MTERDRWVTGLLYLAGVVVFGLFALGVWSNDTDSTSDRFFGYGLVFMFWFGWTACVYFVSQALVSDRKAQAKVQERLDSHVQ